MLSGVYERYCNANNCMIYSDMKQFCWNLDAMDVTPILFLIFKH